MISRDIAMVLPRHSIGTPILEIFPPRPARGTTCTHRRPYRCGTRGLLPNRGRLDQKVPVTAVTVALAPSSTRSTKSGTARLRHAIRLAARKPQARPRLQLDQRPGRGARQRIARSHQRTCHRCLHPLRGRLDGRDLRIHSHERHCLPWAANVGCQ
jgi:hypothetical protein